MFFIDTMVNKARISKRINSRDLESEIMDSVYASDVVTPTLAVDVNSLPHLPPTKRQRTTSYIPDQFISLIKQ